LSLELSMNCFHFLSCCPVDRVNEREDKRCQLTIDVVEDEKRSPLGEKGRKSFSSSHSLTLFHDLGKTHRKEEKGKIIISEERRDRELERGSPIKNTRD